MIVTAYTDGSCLEQNGVGAYAIMFIGEHGVKEVVKGNTNTTNNKMELEAVVEAMRIYKDKLQNKYAQLVICSDSAYVVNAFNQDWLTGWKLNGWKKADGGDLKNVELWKEAEALRVLNVRFVKVRGHSTDDFNNKVDALAQAEARRIKEELTNGSIK